MLLYQSQCWWLEAQIICCWMGTDQAPKLLVFPVTACFITSSWVGYLRKSILMLSLQSLKKFKVGCRREMCCQDADVRDWIKELQCFWQKQWECNSGIYLRNCVFVMALTIVQAAVSLTGPDNIRKISLETETRKNFSLTLLPTYYYCSITEFANKIYQLWKLSFSKLGEKCFSGQLPCLFSFLIRNHSPF